MKILVLGTTGMLGHVVYRHLAADPDHRVTGTCRGAAETAIEPGSGAIRTGVDATETGCLETVIAEVRPEAVVNCIGLVKQLDAARDPEAAIAINALLPHRLARLCRGAGARLVHVSTDCVFSGTRGGYREEDIPDATDLYGRSKLLGEVDDGHAVTLRTSIIGPELGGQHGLLGWFLSQKGPVKGFRRAIFSGLSTDELARVIAEQVLPRTDLHGVYHVSAEPIDKYMLLCHFRDAYGLDTAIRPDDALVIDQSLDSSRFRQATGYSPPDWPSMIRRMRAADATPGT